MAILGNSAPSRVRSPFRSQFSRTIQGAPTVHSPGIHLMTIAPAFICALRFAISTSVHAHHPRCATRLEPSAAHGPQRADRAMLGQAPGPARPGMQVMGAEKNPGTAVPGFEVFIGRTRAHRFGERCRQGRSRLGEPTHQITARRGCCSSPRRSGHRRLRGG